VSSMTVGRCDGRPSGSRSRRQPQPAGPVGIGNSAASSLTTDVTALKRSHVEAFLADLRDRPARHGGAIAPATVKKHYPSLQQFFKWLKPRVRPSVT